MTTANDKAHSEVLEAAKTGPVTLEVASCARRCMYVMYVQQISPYFDPTYTRTGWIGQPPVLDRHEVVTDNGEVDTLRQATP